MKVYLYSIQFNNCSVHFHKKLCSFRSIVQILRFWLERYFEQDFYVPPKHVLLKRLCAIAEELHDDSGETTQCDGDCDLLTFVKSKLQKAEVKGMQEQACQS